MWQTWAELHGAVSAFPVALIIMSVVFDLIGSFTKRESLKAAAFWCLTFGSGIAVLAVVTGLLSKDSIEHGAAIHRAMTRHQTLALSALGFLTVLAVWRAWRRSELRATERKVYLGAAVVAGVLVAWVGHLGGNIVFRHAGGVPTHVLESSLADRAQGHSHAPGEEHDDGNIDEGGAEVQDTEAGDDHQHAPGTPSHDHD